VRGTLKSALALLAAASFGGWVVTLGLLMGTPANGTVISIAFWSITVLYGVLALAIGSVQGRRLGPPGIVVAVLASLLAWLILELFFHLFEISSVQMRAPLMAGIALAIVGAVIGAQRAADLAATEVDLEDEDTPVAATDPAEAEPAADAVAPAPEGAETQ